MNDPREPQAGAKPGPEPAADPLQEALALHRAGKHELAMQRYVAILQKEPANTDVLYYVAMMAIQEGQIAEGLKVIDRALAVGKPQARIYNLLGQAHLRQNQDADAVAAFGKAIETDPAFADAYGNRGALLAEMKRFPEALADLDDRGEAASRQPDRHLQPRRRAARSRQARRGADRLRRRARADADARARALQPRRDHVQARALRRGAEELRPGHRASSPTTPPRTPTAR